MFEAYVKVGGHGHKNEKWSAAGIKTAVVVAFHLSGYGAQVDVVVQPLQASDSRLSNQIAGVLISSSAGSRVKMYPWRESGPVLGERAALSGLSFTGSCPNCGHVGPLLRTFPGFDHLRGVPTFDSSSPGWPSSGMAWLGESSTLNGSAFRSDGGASFSLPTVILEDVLEPNAPARYSLSARAAAGILRRAERRDKTLPPDLRRALALLAATHQGGNEKMM